jgi:hypothetical protein
MVESIYGNADMLMEDRDRGKDSMEAVSADNGD